MKIKDLVHELCRNFDMDEDVRVCINANEGFVEKEIVGVYVVDLDVVGLFVNAYGASSESLEDEEEVIKE